MPWPVAAVPMKGRCEYRVIPILDSDCVFVYFQPTTTVRGWWRDFLVQVPFGFCLFFRSPVPPVPGSDPRSPRDQAVGEFWVNRVVISGQHSSLVSLLPLTRSGLGFLHQSFPWPALE